MRPKPGYVLCCLGLLICLCSGAWAQEAYPLEGGNDRDGSYVPVDGETGSHLRVSGADQEEFADADTSSYVAPVPAGRSAAQASSDNESAEADNQESVLGFNFLYYIIQKFKMSDIVEK